MKRTVAFIELLLQPGRCKFKKPVGMLLDMSPHSDTLAWFRANQYLLFLLNAAEKQ
jgi:hypothetical protein